MSFNPSLLVGFLVMSAVLSAIPGPSVLLETSRSITQGRTSALWIVLGNFLGGMVLLGLVLCGLGAVVATSAQAFLMLKIAGAAYLFWLGVRALLDARIPVASVFGAPDGRRVGSLTSVRQGFLVGVANPKSIVSLMAILPQFVDPSLGRPVEQMVVIGIAGGVAQVLIETVWVLAAGALRGWFQRRPVRVQRLRGTGGLFMIGMSGKLALAR